MKRNLSETKDVKRKKLGTSERIKPADITSSFADVIDKYPALKFLLDKDDPSSRLMYDLRMSLFMAAASDANLGIYLQPFPPYFIDQNTKAKDFTRLMCQISNLPAFLIIDESTQHPMLTWELMNWVINNPFTFEPLVTDIPAKMKELKKLTGLANLPIPNNTNVFLFNISPPEPKAAFTEAKQKYGSRFAFHGSSVKNFHSILNRGLLCSLSLQSGSGYGTYLSSDINLAKGYAYMDRGYGWTHSSFGNSNLECVAVVEVVMSPQTKDFGSLYVCDNDDDMQLAHLIIYCN